MKNALGHLALERGNVHALVFCLLLLHQVEAKNSVFEKTCRNECIVDYYLYYLK